MHGNVKKLEKEKYKKWTVIRPAPNRIGYYVVECDCGKRDIVRGSSLRHGYTSSCKSCSQRCFDGSASKNMQFYYYKYAAKRRKISWKLSRERFYELIVSNCAYCGSAPRQRVMSLFNSIPLNGVDRKDSNKGYNFKNCGPCCTECNSLKGKMSVIDFLNHVQKIVLYQQKEN